MKPCMTCSFLPRFRSTSSQIQHEVKLYDACVAAKPDADEIRMLLECGLTVTLPVHLVKNGNFSVIIVASLKLSEDLRKQKVLTDSFPVFCEKYLAISLACQAWCVALPCVFLHRRKWVPFQFLLSTVFRCEAVHLESH